MADEAYRAVFLRVHPTGKMVLSLTTEPDGHEAEYADLVAGMREPGHEVSLHKVARFFEFGERFFARHGFDDEFFIARDNLGALDDPRRLARDVRFVQADAAAYHFPPGDLVVYLYNPFAEPVLTAMLERLCDRPPDDEIVLLYHTALGHGAIEATRAFEVIADVGFGLAYRRRRAA